MTELLHAWAIAPAALGACCLAADRGRARWPDAVATLLMLAAMVDSVLTRVVAPVYWAAAMLVTAMAVAAASSPRRRRVPPAGLRNGMVVHTALGLVAMAALQLGMAHGAPAAAVPSPAAAHAHGGSGTPLLEAALIAGAIAYAVLSAGLLTRSHRALDRVQLACMAVSVLLMGVAALA
ncbi:hypothetical protein JNB62_17380 [Microbacterium jejuense]|uniref:DUF5134 domain-containing protein n=1 Tax=Microbacterium jejuense TaxID=1263637 RepID=A0ABS7HTE0_9MICO|nr:hypothetical protein [Microbacterium jejuense]MBW9095457.1 hypothetical protein [Microbacterium jejuense]